MRVHIRVCTGNCRSQVIFCGGDGLVQSVRASLGYRGNEARPANKFMRLLKDLFPAEKAD